MRRLAVGQVYRHFKKELDIYENYSNPNNYIYQIIAIAIDANTGDKVVVYQAMYGRFQIYTRDYDEFLSEVDREKYPNIRQEYRFELIKDVK